MKIKIEFKYLYIFPNEFINPKTFFRALNPPKYSI